MDALAESIAASQTSKVLKPEKYAAVTTFEGPIS